MKLSVLIPAYNLQEYIITCLVSVLEQRTDFDYEVIVSDDGSTDETAERIAILASRFKGKLYPIYNKKNVGLAANMEVLLKLATGEYVAYVDGDDIALETKLQKQVDYLDQHQDCQMVYHESDMFDSLSGKTIKHYSEGYYNWSFIPPRSSIEHMVRYGTYMQASSVMFRNHPKLQQTVMNTCKIIFDYSFYIQNAGYLQANIDYIPEVLGRYRIHDSSFGQQTSRSYARREQSLIDIELACLAAEQFGISNETIAAGISHHRFAAGLYFLAREADDLFVKHIESSSDGILYFNDKHRVVYENRTSPENVRRILREVV